MSSTKDRNKFPGLTRLQLLKLTPLLFVNTPFIDGCSNSSFYVWKRRKRIGQLLEAHLKTALPDQILSECTLTHLQFSLHYVCVLKWPLQHHHVNQERCCSFRLQKTHLPNPCRTLDLSWNREKHKVPSTFRNNWTFFNPFCLLFHVMHYW